MIIEDNLDISTSLALALSSLGLVTMVAHTGEQGLALVEQFMPDAVLLDIGLPGLNGFEVAQRLRQLPAPTPILVIAVSGYSRDVFREKQTGAQFDHYLLKPVDPISVGSLITSSLAATMARPRSTS